MNVKIDATEKKFQTIFALKMSQWGIVVLYFSALFYTYHKYIYRFWLEKLNWEFLHSISQNNSPNHNFRKLSSLNLFFFKKCWFQ